MRPVDDLAPEQLLGRRVAFKNDEEHLACWHAQVGLQTGVVVKVGQTLAQKAALLGSEGVEIPAELLSEEEETPRLWVRADPCASFPRGCETAVEKDCLRVVDG